VQAAIERLAAKDDRSRSAMIERILKAWLIEHNHLRREADNVD
jgi:hypothetical protein